MSAERIAVRVPTITAEEAKQEDIITDHVVNLLFVACTKAESSMSLTVHEYEELQSQVLEARRNLKFPELLDLITGETMENLKAVVK